MVSYSIFTLLAFYCWNIAVQAAGPCMTPAGDDGKCVPLKECKSLLTIQYLIAQIPENQEYLNQSEAVCRNSGRSGGVCCPFEESLPSFAAEYTSKAEAVDGYQLPLPPNCGESLYDDPNMRIMGGVPVNEGQFPWMTTLGYGDSFNYYTMAWRCGGALITSRHVLTAAHCIVGFENELKIARFGTNNAYDHGQALDRKISNIFVHERYDRISKNHDIAILKLEEDIVDDRVRTICLPLEKSLRENLWHRYNPFVAGWGLVNFEDKDSDSPDMLMTQVPVTRNSVCKNAYESKSWNKTKPYIDDNIICAGYPDGGRDACTGDSGGPLMLPRQVEGGSKYFDIGIVSYGFKCGVPGYPNIYTRVAKYIEWIESKLNL